MSKTVALVVGGGFGVVASLIYAMRFKTSRKWINLDKDPELKEKSLEGQVIVITGANTGLGRQVAEEAAKRGAAAVILACRDPVTGGEAAQSIRESTGNQNVKCLLLDLSSMDSVREFAGNLSKAFPMGVDSLVCNAGVWVPMDQERKTKDGFEIHFGVNHLGHFLLVNLLDKQIKDRVVVVSSGLMNSGKVDPDDLDVYNGRKLQGPSRSHAPTGYSDSKLMNVMFARELANRRPDLMVNAVCPGWCKTDLARYVKVRWHTKLAILVFGAMFMRTARQGSQNILYPILQSKEKLKSGEMYRDGQPVEGDVLKDIEEPSRKLWELSMKLTKLS